MDHTRIQWHFLLKCCYFWRFYGSYGDPITAHLKNQEICSRDNYNQVLDEQLDQSEKSWKYWGGKLANSISIFIQHIYLYYGMNGLKELVPNQANFREPSFTKTRELSDRHFLQSKFVYLICEVGNVTRTFIVEEKSVRTLDFRPHFLNSFKHFSKKKSKCFNPLSAVSQFWSQKPKKSEKNWNNVFLAGNDICEVKLATEFKNRIFIVIWQSMTSLWRHKGKKSNS